jgi:UDP-GlcNAc3NAcA epimerase
MPEEINRVLTDHCSTLLFVPTDTALKNLKNEGIAGAHVIFSGDVMLDIAKWTATFLSKNPSLGVDQNFLPKQYALATIHRAESTDDEETLTNIVKILRHVSQELPIIWPVHPRTKAALERLNLSNQLQNIRTINPLGYFQMTDLTIRSQIVITDSGGLQKEAFFHGKPCVTLRTETEWVELVESQWNLILPPNSNFISATQQILGMKTPDAAKPQPQFYGNGTAGVNIISAIKSYLRGF